uniref:Uncharacterized protein n=1 Tax=Zea mays TaxID=4577 RepID=A0A804LV40_MAIZE
MHACRCIYYGYLHGHCAVVVVRRGGGGGRLVVLAGHLLQGFALGLRHQERECQAQQVAAGEEEQRVAHADARGVPVVRLGRVPVLRQVQEPEGADDGAQLPRRRRDAVARRPQPGREDLSGHDERGRVGPEVGEEEGEAVHDDEADVVPRRRPVLVRHGQPQHEHRHHQEPRHLDREPPQHVDQRHREPVAGHRAAQRDQGLRPRDAEQLLQRVHRRRLGDPPHRAEDVLLEQVLRVEGDVQQEPRRGRAQEVQPVPAEELPGEEPKGRRRRRRRSRSRSRGVLLGGAG